MRTTVRRKLGSHRSGPAISSCPLRLSTVHIFSVQGEFATTAPRHPERPRVVSSGFRTAEPDGGAPMAEFDRYEPGQFCWVELVSGDVPAVKDFYPSLFGWEAHEDPIPGGGIYVMSTLRGRNVAAAYGLDPDERAANAEGYWNSYVSVDDADRVAKAAAEAGGRVSVEPHDVFDLGRTAALVDPTGAELRLWQPGRVPGAQLADEPGSFCWNELLTSDVDRAVAFYGELFGWTTRSDTLPGGQDY